MQSITILRDDLPAELGAWLDGFDDLPAAWRACPRGDWLVQMCLAVDLGRGLVVHAVADATTEALAVRRVGDIMAHRALAVTRRWIEGRASGSEAWAVGFATMEAADELEGRRAEVVRAAACTAFACDDQADPAFYVHQAYAARAAAHAGLALGDPRAAADRIRARVPLHVFLEALEVAAREPAPSAELEAEAPITDSFYC